MQQPQPTYGYATPSSYHGGAPGYGESGHPVGEGGQPYGGAYGSTPGEGYAYGTTSQPLSHQSPEYVPNYHSPNGVYPQEPNHAFAGGAPSYVAPSGPPLEPHAAANNYDTPAPYVNGPVPHGISNPNPHGSDRPPQNEPQGSYGEPAPSNYGYTQSYGSTQPSGYEIAGGLHGTAPSSVPPSYAEGPSSFGAGPAAYVGEQASMGATHGHYAPGPAAAPAAYSHSDTGYGALYGAQAEPAAYPVYESSYGSAQPAPYSQQAPPPATSSYSNLHAPSDIGAKQPSYLSTPPQSSNPPYDSIHAGLSSLNLGNPVSSAKQPNYLDRADSGSNNLNSFKSSYGGTIRYEAPRTSSHSAPRAESSGHGRSSASSELIDIVQGPGSVGGSSYRSGRAQPADTVEGEGGIQRYKVRLMPEDGSAGSAQQVQCQIALDGVRLFNADGKTTLRIYPLESITRWAVQQPTVFTFWAKTAVDVEQRAVKLASNEGTTTAILDTLTAACVQVGDLLEKDSGGSQHLTAASVSAASSDSAKPKGMSILEWVAKKPVVEEKQHWIPDETVTKCSSCGSTFTAFNRRHHCRNCGEVFCDSCTKGRIALTSDEGAPPVRVCDRCFAEVTHRLQNVQPAKAKATPHIRATEDLTKKLQAELDRKRPNPAPASNSGGGGGGQTTVLTCKSCGSVSLSSAGNTHCSACGADANKAPATSSSRSSGGGNRQAAWNTEGPPHLWDQQPAKTGERTRQVACPTCTVHLTVKVPSQGTETVECGVCQHPFLVAA
ncbi:hypothetical protein KFL_001870250 [Klebsormidium nitens]|uniref:FYVE-type domain-containing protein n=1 Tax=Klebsormidium nitens TaxID=105231 RepID=A0A1Y1I1Q7_KLENI|nr:hypothetical protein KFL_001870250 [Klebsormidium nitens]|eukprot:GAQ84403.1 hypothetical protein KFL_001870250 [Klebsormidium nitens]